MTIAYRVHVQGYVFPRFEEEASDADVKKVAERLVEDGELDVTGTLIEGDAFEDNG